MTSAPDPFQSPRARSVTSEGVEGAGRWWLLAVVIMVGAATSSARTLAYAANGMPGSGFEVGEILVGFGAPLIGAAAALLIPRARLLVVVCALGVLACISTEFLPSMGIAAVSAVDDIVLVLAVVMFARRSSADRRARWFFALFAARVVSHAVSTGMTMLGGLLNQGPYMTASAAMIALGASLALVRQPDRDDGEPNELDLVIVVGAVVIAVVTSIARLRPDLSSGVVGSVVGLIFLSPPLIFIGRSSGRTKLAVGVLAVGVAAIVAAFSEFNFTLGLVKHATLGVSDAMWFVVVLPFLAMLRMDRWAPLVVASGMFVDRLLRHAAYRTRGLELDPSRVLIVSGAVAVVAGVVMLATRARRTTES